jgi:peptidoglycan/LPS O-acetylase OafA/YrhL
MGCIRFLLATWVIVIHSESLFGVIGPDNLVGLNGDMAVTCFFMISGFLIAMILQQRYHSLGVFYVTRSIRIYAPYYVALLLTLTLYLLGYHLGTDFGKSVRAAADSGNVIALLFFFVSNYTIFGTELATYLASSNGLFPDVHILAGHKIEGYTSWIHLLMVPQAWTLSLELQFYLLAPFLCRLRPAVLGLMTLLLYIGINSSVHSLAQHGIQPDLNGSLVFQLPYFLFGVLG